MKKRSPFLTTYLALVVLVVLGSYMYFVESKKPAESQKPKEKVFTLDKSQAKEVTLSPDSGDAIHLVKSGTTWRMAAPLVVPADSGEVESLLSSLEGLEVDEVVEPNATRLEDYGLEPPKLKVSVLAGAAPVELWIGDKAPTGSGLYAKLPNQPRLFTIPSYLESSLRKKPFDLRDRDLLHVKRDAVKTLEVTGPSTSYTLVRGEGGEFQFTKPLVTRAGRWSVDGLLGNLESLKMDSIAEETAKNLKPFGLDKPVWTVSMDLNDGTKRTLEIGSSPSAKKYHARDAASPLVAVIPSAVADELAKGIGELRAKRLLEIATYEVEGFEVATEGGVKVYTRSSTKSKDGIDLYKWKRTKPDTKDLETSKVEDQLFKLGGIEVKEFLDKPKPSGYGFDHPLLKVTIKISGGKPSVWAEISKEGSDYFGRRPGDDAVLKLDPAKAEEVIKGYDAL